TLADQKLDHLVDDIGRAMGRYFNHVFSGKGTRGDKQGDQHFVDDLFTIAKSTKVNGVGSLFLQIFSFKHFIGQPDGLFSRKADDRNGTYTLRSSQSHNGVVPLTDIKAHLRIE